MSTDLETVKKRLEEAEAAMHVMATTGRTVEVLYPGGQRVKFSEAQMSELRSYINMLKQQIAEAEGRSSRRPVRFGF